MARYTARDASRLREVEAELGCIRETGRPALEWLAPTVCELIDTEKSATCAYAPRGDALTVVPGGVARLSSGIYLATERCIQEQGPISWTSYNPLRPEPAQRNAVLTKAAILRVTGLATGPVVAEVYAKFGIAHHDTLRVLVCEGASLLGYLAFFQANDFDLRQQRVLRHLVPAIRRRLSCERLMSGARSTRLLLDAAMDEITGAAFVVSDRGVVLEVNRVGQLWLERNGLTGRRALRDAVVSPDLRTARSFRVTKVASAGVSPRYLVVEAATVGGLQVVRSAGVRWGFSRREIDVLASLAEGVSTRTIAAELAIAERTVEAHLTSMFEKAQVETRGELVAKAMRGG